MTNKQLGALGVLRVAYAYQALGRNVLFPYGDTQKYDLVTEQGGIFQKVQVKTVTEKDGLIYADTRVIGHNLKRINVYKPEVMDFDILAIVEVKSLNVYAVPFDGSKRQFSLRIGGTRNNQIKDIHSAEKYLLQ